MDSFINNVDFFVGNKPEDLAAKFGTPLYVYNEEIVRNRMTNVTKVITKYPYTANYSVKANTNLSILRIACELGLNADAMSVNEMRLLLIILKGLIHIFLMK